MRRSLIGLMVIVGLGIPLGVSGEEIQLDVGTSTTLSPLPPVPTILEIDEHSPAEATLDKPLSLMGEILLDAVCAAWIPPDFALKIFPDLSAIHIQQACPQVMPS
ncbi:MAG: hypothetical protein Q6K08_01420 [Thermostichales cyanobacterium GMQP_bins_62]